MRSVLLLFEAAVCNLLYVKIRRDNCKYVDFLNSANSEWCYQNIGLKRGILGGYFGNLSCCSVQILNVQYFLKSNMDRTDKLEERVYKRTTAIELEGETLF